MSAEVWIYFHVFLSSIIKILVCIAALDQLLPYIVQYVKNYTYQREQVSVGLCILSDQAY